MIPEGLRVLQLPMPASEVVYCGIAVHAGTRHETASEHGLAHFCEHLCFKGTQRRSARQIINAIEGLGGELNAFTNKEDTVFYCVIQRQHWRKAVDVLCDIVFCSQFPQQEVEKEREVVCDEIESYEDSPAELIYDEFENLLFDSHPLGHNILGNADAVRSYTSDDARRFTQCWYRPENCLLFVTESLPKKTLPLPLPEKVAYPATHDQQTDGVTLSPLTSEEAEGRLVIRSRATHQAHVMTGTRTFAANDDRRWALYLLNNILGGPAMNSRLNLSLRERNGLVYTVDSTMVSYSDTGLWAVYFGCDPHDVNRCLWLVRRELDRLMEKPLSPTQLRAAKQQLQGQLVIASENREQYVLDRARAVLHTGKELTLADVMARIDRLTADDLLSTARQLFTPGNIVTLIYK